MEVQRICDGLWRWTAPHPDWIPAGEGPHDWPEQVGCVYYEAPDATVLIDPLVPRDAADAVRFTEAFDRDVARRGLPVVVLRTIRWHERSRVAIDRRYGLRRRWPAGVEAIPIGDPQGEVALWLPEHRALVVGDILLGSDVHGDAPGGLAVAPPSWHRDPPAQAAWYARAVPGDLRRLAALRPERVLVAHGTPVLADAAAALDAALRTA
jgi:glyoxylase-like metal-dependent hydrolase (beta-lactamase superfamily II)